MSTSTENVAPPPAATAQLTPHQIVDALDRYIIGQHKAKKAVAIALRNRWRRQNAPEEMRNEIMPNNIIMIGPTGVGKTEIARRLARLANAPFIKVEATKFTEVGYVGRDVESIVRDLVELAVTMVKTERQELVAEKAARQAEQRLLEIMLPPPPKSVSSFGFADQENAEEHAAARKRLEEQLLRGELHDRTVEIDVQLDGPPVQMFGPMNLEDMGINLQDMLNSVVPKKTQKRKVKVAEALRILAEEEAEKLVDMDSVVKEALHRTEQSGIVFIDEIDKIASSSSVQGADVSRSGVQRDLLPIVEGSTVSTKYGMVKTDHVLFIASGAFHVAKPSDLLPELQGRFPIRVELESLTEEDFYKILTVPENALTKQYKALLSTEKIELSFQDDAIREIAAIAAKVNEEVVNIGARRLHTILSTLLEELMFDTPDVVTDDTIVVSREMVTNKLNNIVGNQDLSKYIL